MLDNNFVKLIAWYDNEWGYTNKILDLIGLHAYSGPEPVIRFLGRRQMPASYFFHINIVLCTLSIKY